LNIPIDVIAAFNISGDVKPLFVRTENKNEIHICKINEIVKKDILKILGNTSIEFNCTIDIFDTTIDIRYNVELHKWYMITNKL